jgi:hypothetical protein
MIPSPRFFLTRNERKCAGLESCWRLVIITNAKANPQMQLLTLPQVESIYTLPHSHGNAIQSSQDWNSQ